MTSIRGMTVMDICVKVKIPKSLFRNLNYLPPPCPALNMGARKFVRDLGLGRAPAHAPIFRILQQPLAALFVIEPPKIANRGF